MKQIDIFGNEVSVDKIILKTPKKGRQTIKNKFRTFNGYKHNYFCKNCKYFKEFRYNTRNIFKCEKMGITGSEATDIRKKDVACNLYQEKVKGA